MRPLTPQERRTIRFGAWALAAYLVVFFGVQVWRSASRRRADYDRLLVEAATFQQRLQVYRDKAQVITDLQRDLRFDPARLQRDTLVAEATAAIHQAALGGGIQLGPIRETPSRATARELTAVQLEGVGQVAAILRFIHSLPNLGFPLLADSLELTPEARQPGQVKMTVTILLLDFDQWKPAAEPPNA